MSNINPDIFRRYDIRGVVPDDFDEGGIEQIGHALVKAVQSKKVIVGFGCEMHLNVLFGHQLIKQVGVADVSLNNRKFTFA